MIVLLTSLPGITKTPAEIPIYARQPALSQDSQVLAEGIKKHRPSRILCRTSALSAPSGARTLDTLRLRQFVTLCHQLSSRVIRNPQGWQNGRLRVHGM